MRHSISNSAFENTRTHLQTLMGETQNIESSGGFNFPCGEKIVAVHVTEDSLETVNCGEGVDLDSTELCHKCYEVHQSVVEGNYKTHTQSASSSIQRSMVNYVKNHPKLMVGLGLGLAVLAGVSAYASTATGKTSTLVGNTLDSVNSTLINSTLTTSKTPTTSETPTTSKTLTTKETPTTKEMPTTKKTLITSETLTTKETAVTEPQKPITQTKGKTKEEILQEKWSKNRDKLPLLFHGAAFYLPSIAGADNQFVIFKKTTGYKGWRKFPEECDAIIGQAKPNPRKKFQIVIQSRENVNGETKCNVDIEHGDEITVGLYDTDYMLSPFYTIPNGAKSSGKIIFAGYRFTKFNTEAGIPAIGVLNNNTFQSSSEYKTALETFVIEAAYSAHFAGFTRDEFKKEVAKLTSEFGKDKYDGFGFVDAINKKVDSLKQF